MKRILTVYPNCSLGGMTSVYLGRVANSKKDKFDFLFLYDRGGKEAFSNLNFRIIRKDRFINYFNYTISNGKYDEVRITSYPELTHNIQIDTAIKVIYEFHTSSIDIIEKEIQSLNKENISEIWVPSLYLKNILLSFLGQDIPIIVVPNTVDTSIFTPYKKINMETYFPKNSRPVFWIGRLDKGKNYKDFFRLLSLLPSEYVGYVILSFENEPTRISEALLEAELYRINTRVHFLLNLKQYELVDLYISSFKNKGIFCSTSLAESFGYGVLEAALVGLPVVTYEVGGISEHKQYGFSIHMIDVGDTKKLAESIKSLNWTSDHYRNIKSWENYSSNK